MTKKCKYDIIGKTFTYLTVIEKSKVKKRCYTCICVCGNTHEATSQALRSGGTKSCGCMKSKLLADSFTIHGGYKDGKNTPEYQSYMAMKHRCYNKNRKRYKNYGGRGILIDEPSWLEDSPNGFLNFKRDMGSRPEGTSLDRIDSNRGYSKENCRWASRSIQAMNTDRLKRKNSTSKYRGVSLDKKTGKWIARIGDGKGGCERLGRFKKEVDAAKAYNKRCIEIYGDIGILNDIDE